MQMSSACSKQAHIRAWSSAQCPRRRGSGWRTVKFPCPPLENVEKYSCCSALAGSEPSVIALTGDAPFDSDDEQPIANPWMRLPWVRLLALAFSTLVVGLVEWLWCKRPPTFWAPVTALGGTMLWRASLRDVAGSNLPPRSPDRFFMLAFFVLVLILERQVLHQVLYTPWLCAIAFMIVSPSTLDMDNREQQLRVEASKRTRQWLANRIPATPKESSAWVGRLLSCYWTPFFEPMALGKTMMPVQEQLEAAAPRGWTLSLDSFTLGNVGPELTDWQVFNNVNTGNVDIITAKMEFESSSFRTELSGTGPFVGKFTGTLQGISVRGNIQLTPMNNARILLFSFTERPELDLKLAIRGPFIGKQSIPQFAFLRSIIIDAIEQDFVEPNRGMIPLEYEAVPGKPLLSEVIVRVVKVFDLRGEDRNTDTAKAEAPKAEEKDGISIIVETPKLTKAKAAEKAKKLIAKAAGQISAVRVSVEIPEVKLTRQTSLHKVNKDGEATVDQEIRMQLTSETGNLFLNVLDENNRKLGTARLQAAHLPDGATAFWGNAAGGRAIATRWNPDCSPWRVRVPVQGTEKAGIELEVSMSQWQYSLDISSPIKFRSALKTAVAVQVLEGRSLVSKDIGGTSDPYVLVSYNRRAAATRCVYQTLDPVFGDTLIFQENRSALSRRMRVEVFDRDTLTSDDSCGFASINLDLLAEGSVSDQWVQLRGETRGELHLRLLVLSGVADSAEVLQAASNVFNGDPAQLSSDVVKVTILKTENVPGSKPVNVVLTYGAVQQSTARADFDDDNKTITWNEELSVRSQPGQQVTILLKQGSGKEMVRQGTDLCSASFRLDTVYAELATLRRREEASSSAPKGGVAKARTAAPVSISRLMYGDLGRSPVKQVKAPPGVKVAQGGKAHVRMTDVYEKWIPLSGRGMPDTARILVKIQGVLGKDAVISEPVDDARAGDYNDDELASYDVPKANEGNPVMTWIKRQTDSLARQFFN